MSAPEPQAPPDTALCILTGASGSGKTTLLKRVVKTYFPDLSYYHFDDIGVPTLEEMQDDFGGPDNWQAHATRLWLKKIALSNAPLTVLDAQVKPSLLKGAADRYGLFKLNTVLIDCGHEERRNRLIHNRSQLDLDTLDMYAWAAYLRGQADALELEIIDTTLATTEESAKELAQSIEGFSQRVGVSKRGDV